MSVAVGESASRPVTTAELGCALLAFLAASLWWLWPLPTLWSHAVAYRDFGSALVHADVDLMLWVLSWGAHALATDPWNVFSANSFHPAPLSLAFSEHLLGQQVFFGPIYAVTGNPVLAVNLLIVGAQTFCGLGMYLFARRFVSPLPAFVGGFLFAFHPWRWEILGHFYILSYQYVPFAMLFTERLLERGRLGDAVGLALCLLLQLGASFYLAYGLVLAYGIYLPIALWRWRASLDRRRWAYLLGAGVAAGIPFVLTSVPYLLVRRMGFVPSYQGDEGAAFLGLGAAFARQHVLRYLTSTGMGPVAYGLALVGLFSRRVASREVRLTGLVLGVAGILLAFGPYILVGGVRVPSPFQLLQLLVPGFDAVRVPARLVLIAQVGLGLLAAIGLQRLIGGQSRAVQSGAAAVLLTVAVWGFGPRGFEIYERDVGPTVPEAYRWLGENGDGRPLLELPRGTPPERSRRMYLSHAHWLPLLHGYTAYSSDFSSYVHRIARGLPSEESFARLTGEVDVGWILVHRDEFPPALAGVSWDDLPVGLENVKEFGPDLLLRVSSRPSERSLPELLPGERSQGGASLEPLTACPGSLEVLGDPAGSWVGGQKIRLRVRVRNEGARALPAMAPRPLHLVRIAVCFAAADAPLCSGPSAPLWEDVPAGGEAVVRVPVRVPPLPGPARVDVQLIQVGVGPLQDCGFRPASKQIEISGPGTGPARGATES